MFAVVFSFQKLIESYGIVKRHEQLLEYGAI